MHVIVLPMVRMYRARRAENIVGEMMVRKFINLMKTMYSQT